MKALWDKWKNAKYRAAYVTRLHLHEKVVHTQTLPHASFSPATFKILSFFGFPDYFWREI